MTPVTTDELRNDVRQLFLPADDKSAREAKSIGAELEMIPVYRSTGQRVLAQSGNPSGADFVGSLARESGWTEENFDPDPCSWSFEDGRISFEPGGQIEFSSAVFPTASGLLRVMEKCSQYFSTRAERAGIDLKTIGIEDHATIESVPPQLHRRRYAEMNRYFDSIGEFGVVMMRQTASLQINVDRGENPLERWRLLNSLAPYLVAIFANSARYAGSDTGHKSYRAHVWRMLDPLRTGMPYSAADPIGAYLDFALDAPVILAERTGEFYPTFRALLSANSATREMWEVHLTTLFPEVRPREYFEIRSIDALDPSHIGAAVAFVCGIVYDEKSAADAIALVGDPEISLLAEAGKSGLSNTAIRKAAKKLASLALQGCRSLGPAYISETDVEGAEQFFEYRTQ